MKNLDTTLAMAVGSDDPKKLREVKIVMMEALKMYWEDRRSEIESEDPRLVSIVTQALDVFIDSWEKEQGLQPLTKEGEVK